MRDLSDDSHQAEADAPSAKPAWSAPGFEVLKIDQTANSGFAVQDTSVGTGPAS